MTTRDLWAAFARGGVMVHCVRYGGQDPDYGPGVLEALGGEVISCPSNVSPSAIPALWATRPVAGEDDPVAVAHSNAQVAVRILREVVRQTGLTFRFSGETERRPFVFDGPNPTVSVEPDESVELDGLPVTVHLSAAGCRCAAEAGGR